MIKTACEGHELYAQVSSKITNSSGLMTVKSEIEPVSRLWRESKYEKEGEKLFAGSGSSAAVPITINYQIKFFRVAFNIAEKEPQSSLLRNMFHKEWFPDCVIVSSEGQAFKAHKSVLALNSEVFLSMFTDEFQENKSGEVVLDESTVVVKELLRFFYYRDVEGLDPIAEALLVAADKYLVQDLKQVCAVPILKKLNVDNAIRLAILGFQHNCQEIEEYATTFIAR